jgi:hypothetical protein
VPDAILEVAAVVRQELRDRIVAAGRHARDQLHGLTDVEFALGGHRDRFVVFDRARVTSVGVDQRALAAARARARRFAGGGLGMNDQAKGGRGHEHERDEREQAVHVSHAVHDVISVTRGRAHRALAPAFATRRLVAELALRA